MERSLGRVTSYDEWSNAIAIDGAAHRALFVVAVLLENEEPEPTGFLLGIVLELVGELPRGSTGPQFMARLRERAGASGLSEQLSEWFAEAG